MMEMPAVFIPPLLVKLLTKELIPNANTHREVVEVINQDKSMRILCENTFKEFDKNKNLESIVKSMGWESFRNRLISLFFVKIKGHKYPLVTLPDEIAILLEFEKKYEEFTLKNNSKLILLAFYLMQSQFQLERDYSHFKENIISFSEDIHQALTLAQNKSVDLDWILLTLWQFHELLGSELFLKQIKLYNGQYLKLYDCLNVDQKELLMKNLMTYAMAKGSEEILFQSEMR